MSLKTVIVTGATAGLGFELAKQLFEDAYEVIMACRNMQRADNAVKRIKDLCPDAPGKLVTMQLDLANLQSVRDFATKFKESYSTLSVLVNNAGVSGAPERRTTIDGFEETVATNHLGHFLLAHLLLDVLKSTASAEGEARIVVVASQVHIHGKEGGFFLKPMDMDDLMLEKRRAYSSIQAYRNSKAMNVMFTMKLHRMLEGTNVTVNCICPGFVPATEISREATSCMKCIMCCLLPCLKCCGITRTLETGARHMFDLCDMAEMKGVSGRWYLDGREKEISAEARDVEKQEEIWTWSCQLCGL